MLRKIGRLVSLVVVLAAISVVAGSLLGQPVLLSYVETGSMEPALAPGDGFVAIPAALAGPVEVGDVVVFRPEKLDRERITHRVVGATERGYITKGDANPFTDQDDVERPVKRHQIEAKALQIRGAVVAVPHLGTAVETTGDALFFAQSHLSSTFRTGLFVGTQGLAYLFFLCSLVWYGVGVLRGSSRRNRSRERTRESGTDVRILTFAFASLLVVGATASMVVPAGPHQYGVVSTEVDAPSPQIILSGHSETTEYAVDNAGFVPVVVLIDDSDDGVVARPTELFVSRHSQATTTVTLSAPPELGYYRRVIVEHRYLAVLPPATIRTLYELHPWLPIVVIDVLLGVPFYIFGTALVGSGRLRDRSRPSAHSRLARLRLRCGGLLRGLR